jgi:predicted small metal-binding protein
MIDRRFQGSWDSLLVKPDHVDVDVVAKMTVFDDFTLLPPGMKISGRKSLEFSLPKSSDEKLVEHFKHRILTPSALETLTKTIPEIGQDILNELNYYAYAVEEAEVVEGVIAALKDFLERDEISLSDIDSLKPRIDEFVKLVDETVNSLEHIVEQHVSSGKSLTIENHKNMLIRAVSTSDDFSGIK